MTFCHHHNNFLHLLTIFTTTTTFVFEALVRLQTRFCIKSFNLYSGQAGDTSDCQQHSVPKMKGKNTRPNNVLLAVWSTKSSYTFYKDYWRHFDVWRRRLWCSAFLLHFYSILTLRLNKKYMLLLHRLVSCILCSIFLILIHYSSFFCRYLVFLKCQTDR